MMSCQYFILDFPRPAPYLLLYLHVIYDVMAELVSLEVEVVVLASTEHHHRLHFR